MKSRFLKITFAAALVVVAGVTAYHAQDKETLSDLTLANIEALAGDESTTPPVVTKYEIKKETSTEIWDDATQTYKKVVIIDCEGKGSLDC